MSNARLEHRDGFRPKLIALSVAACFSVSAANSSANPTGGTVASGSATFASSGSMLTITNTANTIINWQNFSIGVNEITRFLQSSGSSAVLNRVTGANGVIPQSVIDGVLSSNGRVFLLNSSGIVIGAGARIDVAGFVASSLNLSNKDFLAGTLRFTETPGAGKVSNAGVIDTTSSGPGGRVFLVGPDVENSGVIRTPQGQIVLAAGKSVELVSENSPFVTVNITADSEQALNVGQLLADSGRIGIFGALVRQGGVAQANSAIAGENGEIRLVATKDLTLDAGSVTTANGPTGGNVLLQAQGGTNLISGTVEAKGSSAQGGTIQALGVRVGVIGNGIIDASGDAGGGTVLVGGDAHGANPNVQNAERTIIGSNGVIRADAGTTGDGGRVIVWADGDTRFYGSVSVQGGAQSGNGGFVETSGTLGLDIAGGRVNASAPNGQLGTWLLDPVNVSIISGVAGAPGTDPAISGAAPGVDVFAANPVNGGVVTTGTLQAAFTGSAANMHVQATNNVGFYADLALSYSGGVKTFEVRAQNNIDLAADGVAHTITTNGQNVTLSANDIGPNSPTTPQLNTVSGTGSILGGGNITTNSNGGVGGNIILSGYGVNVGTLQTAGGLDTRTGALLGNVTIVALGGGVTTGNITTRGSTGADFLTIQGGLPPQAGGNGGVVNITAGYGSVSTGNIDASGGNGGNGGYVSPGVLFGGASGGNGGTVSIGATTYGAVTSIAVGTIKSGGGAGGLGGSGGSYSSYSSALVNIGYGGDGGFGGTINLAAGTIATADINVAGGNGGAGGSNNNITVYGGGLAAPGNGDLIVGAGGNGGGGGSIILNGNGATTGALNASGGAGGAGGAGNTAITIAGAATTFAFSDAEAGSGGFGGFGGQVQLNIMGPVNVTGTITTIGGAGGAGGDNSTAKATVYGQATASQVDAFATAGLGGDGGGGGSVTIGGSIITTGVISTGSSVGGAGGANGNAQAYASTNVAGSFFSAEADASLGGNSAFAGQVQISGGTINTGAINAAGAAGGAAGAGGVASASGYGTTPFLTTFASFPGTSGQGGFVSMSAPGGITTGAIDVSGGSGEVDLTTVTGDIVTGAIDAHSLSPSSPGGQIFFTTDTGRVIVNGSIDARGSDGVGVPFDFCSDGCFGFSYGGSAGGVVSFSRTGIGDPAGGEAIRVYGSILVSGGNGFSPQGAAGGNGGSGGFVTVQATYGGVPYGAVFMGDIDAHAGIGGTSAAGFNGGNGGSGGQVAIQSAAITTGSININGGAGGAGGADAGNGAGYGGIGGQGGLAALFAYGVTTGNITGNGGDGGNGGSSASAGQGGRGGDGGAGGSVEAFTNFVSGSSVTLGSVSLNGGRGGNGGASVSGMAGAGGNGGLGGELLIDPDSVTVGAVAAAGGAGGIGGAGGVQGGAGGIGGDGGFVDVLATNTLSYGGTLAIGNIDVSGGAGGAGGASNGANVYGGLGGAGGLGGSVDLLAGTIDLTSGGTINATGGAGGAGGSGVGGYGGNGGVGGYGGFVDLVAPTADPLAYGTILTVNGLQAFVDGGGGGAGGAIGGLGGLSGLSGSFVVNGTVQVEAGTQASLDANTVIQGTNQLILTNTAPSADDIQKKQKEDKQKKQAAACK